METISRLICACPPPSFLRFAISTHPFHPSRVSIGRFRSYNYNIIKLQIRERRSKQCWRWEKLSSVDPSTEEHQGSSSEEDEEEVVDDDDDAMSDEELAEEMEVLEKEAMEGPDEGLQPSDYDRRAQIFYESSRIFKVLKEKHDSNGATAGNY